MTDYKSSNPSSKLSLRSIHGRRCISKCYPKNGVYLHPLLLTTVKDPYHNSCAIEPVHSRDPRYVRENDMILADTCNLEDNKTHIEPDELESILLSFNFQPRDFLSGIYDLHTFDDVIYWTLENDYLPFGTIKRVHDCAWKVFGNNLTNLSTGVFEYYFDISQNYWLKDYVVLLENNFSFNFVKSKGTPDTKDTQDTENTSDTLDEIYHIVRGKFYTYEFFVNCVKKYVKQYQNIWEEIPSHYDNLKNYICECLSKYINEVYSINTVDETTSTGSTDSTDSTDSTK